MRFVTYVHGGAEAAGVLAGQRIHPLPSGTTVLDAIGRGPAGLRATGEAALARPAAAALEEVRLLAPFRPPTIRDFVAFEAHIEGVSKALDGLEHVPEVWYPNPAFYFTNPHAVIGPYDEVPIPPRCQVFDFETEIGAVVGTEGHDLTPEQAREHIIGYTIFNDWSARDLQRPEKELGLGFSKGKDSANTLGPCLVTADELEHLRDAEGFLDLTVTVELNGQVLGKDSAASMSWTFDELVAYASRGTWVKPGDVLGSGTCGRGCLAEIWGRAGTREPAPLSAGDVVTLTVEGIGTISNTVVANDVEVVPLPAARRRDRGPRH
ncbi:MAG TPA: fumarylacetoacetate hydrolase family protein [Pseudonocardiaceae bacterium]|jgi:2-keto-4-pentenoate hydratase/2-oxohepta-3-ene-1,7-dioic acid hydratase in catechol pathway|nr:fumarylacetoacetate hydrolase family protein [Pseudonocardiaceae bacterium]